MSSRRNRQKSSTSTSTSTSTSNISTGTSLRTYLNALESQRQELVDGIAQSRSKDYPNETEMKEIVTNLVRLLLAKDRTKEPFNTDNLKPAFGRFSNKDVRKLAMDYALQIIEETFGYSTISLIKPKQNDDPIETLSQQPKVFDSTHKKVFIFENTILESNRNEIINFKPSFAERGLLMIIFSIIVINGGTISSDALSSHLQGFGLRTKTETMNSNSENSNSNSNHPFPPLTKLLTTFNQQLYLTKYKQSNKELYSMGPRARHEVSLSDILSFIHKIHGDITLNSATLAEMERKFNDVEILEPKKKSKRRSVKGSGVDDDDSDSDSDSGSDDDDSDSSSGSDDDDDSDDSDSSGSDDESSDEE